MSQRTILNTPGVCWLWRPLPGGYMCSAGPDATQVESKQIKLVHDAGKEALLWKSCPGYLARITGFWTGRNLRGHVSQQLFCVLILWHVNRYCVKGDLRVKETWEALVQTILNRCLYSRASRTFIMQIDILNLEGENKLCSFSTKQNKTKNQPTFLDYLVGVIVYRAHIGKHGLIYGCWKVSSQAWVIHTAG